MNLNQEEKETKGMTAIMIIEVVGKPAEHINETLNKIVGDIGKEKGVVVNESKINEPVSLKENPTFYTAFAEIEVEVETISHLAGLMFKYMPAHIEILSPGFIALTNSGWNDVFNELVRRLHGYDEVARIIQVEKNILEKQLKNLLDKENTEKDSLEEKEED